MIRGMHEFQSPISPEIQSKVDSSIINILCEKLNLLHKLLNAFFQYWLLQL